MIKRKISLLVALLFILPCAIINATEKVEEKSSDEGFIREDLIWQYYNDIRYFAGKPEPEDHFIINMRFHGTTEINGKTYHNLYYKFKGDMWIEDDEKYIEEFNFDEMTPDFYIRKEGDKYYMLLARDHYWWGHTRDFIFMYGSKEIETVIYNLRAYPIPGYWGYYMVENMTGSIEDPWPDGYNPSFLSAMGLPLSVGVNCHTLNKKIEVAGKPYNLTFTTLSENVDEYGVVGNGILPVPGAMPPPFGNGKLNTIRLRCVYDLDGNIIFPWGRCPGAYMDGLSSIGEISDTADKPFDIYGIDGRLVRSGATDFEGLAPGIYISGGKKILIK